MLYPLHFISKVLEWTQKCCIYKIFNLIAETSSPKTGKSPVCNSPKNSLQTVTSFLLSQSEYNRVYFLSLGRLRFTFTPNGKREFVPRDQVFFLIVVYCLLLLLKNKYFHASFIHKNCSGQFLFSYFLFWEILNLNPTLAVCRKRES